MTQWRSLEVRGNEVRINSVRSSLEMALLADNFGPQLFVEILR